MAEKFSRINLRFDPEDFDKLNEKRFRERLSFQQLGARLFDRWLVGDVPSPVSIRKPADPLLEKFAMLQVHGDKEQLELLKKVIDVTYLVMERFATPEELAHLRAVVYGEAEPDPRPEDEAS